MGRLADDVAVRVEALYRRDGRRVFATLVRLLGDMDRAEEALQDACRAALEQWPVSGVPANPSAWLVSTGRFKAIDAIRRERRQVAWDDTTAALAESAADPIPAWDEREWIEDDRLRLVFTCCHPSLSDEARLALTLREVCGLTTEEIARAFLVPAPTVAQRIVRAKSKISAARIPYRVPDPEELPDRLSSVLRVLYLVFNEGYSATAGAHLIRHDLAEEAIRVARLLHALMSHPEVAGLLALMLLQHARRDARLDPDGDLVPLEQQDRTRWDRTAIAEGAALVERTLAGGAVGPYVIQAAIAAVHGEAPTAAATDWTQIVGLYDVLSRLDGSPVVALNRAVAVAMRDGPGPGLAIVERLLETDHRLARYHLAHAARADLLRRAGRLGEARDAYVQAQALARQEPERRFLARKVAELEAGCPVDSSTSRSTTRRSGAIAAKEDT